MAANRFATMVHRSSNKITLILIYAVLEWVLIVLLLLNSLFSYLILKFAEYFGLKPPCPWCTRIDHVIDSSKGKRNLHRDNLCEVHAREVSGLGYCVDHRKLVESRDMCEDCLSSRPEFLGSSNDFGFLKRFGKNSEEMVGENGEISLNCSCCGVNLGNNKYSSYVLVRTSSFDALEYAQKQNLHDEAGVYVDDDHVQKGFDCTDKKSDFGADFCGNEILLQNKDETQMLSGFHVNLEVKEKETKENGCNSGNVNLLEDVVFEVEEKETLLEEISNLITADKSVQVCFEEEVPVENLPQHLEFFLDYSGHRLVPIELVDSMTEEHKSGENTEIEDDDKNKDQECCPDSEVQVEEKEEAVVGGGDREEKAEMFLDIDINEEPKYGMLESMELEEDENSLVFHAKDCHLVTQECENSRVFVLTRWPSEETRDDVQEPAGKHSDAHTVDVACEEVAQANNENEADVSIGTEIPDLDVTDEIQIQESVRLNECIHEDPLASSADFHEAENSGPTRVDEQMVELQSSSVQDNEQGMNQTSSNLDSNDTEEDKVPDTPTSVDSINYLHKKLLMLEKRDSGTEESLDGSITSELEGGDGAVTIERLKTALRSERKALQVLYTELEEERSASAVAANQTMAMINRLQEEKAAMQMEALQYQRMMEEQSEYDQEALQLLNELMVKREKEKQELEKELEACRKKLLDYEMKEKVRMLKRSKDGSTRSGFSSASCSNAEDSDGLSIDLNLEAKEDEGFYNHQGYGNPGTPVDAVVNLEESLADFEEERLSILEQLKVLEEKLLTLDDDNEQYFEDVKSMRNLHEENGMHEENGNHVDGNGHSNGEANGNANGFPNDTVKHNQQRKIAVQMGKSLLPLFDAISDENGELIANGDGVDSNTAHDHHRDSIIDKEDKKHAIEEEVDHLYERLQALEADREFLKHCIRSLKKGDKGTDLLQEILQHLRDLRSVELRVRNITE